MQWASYCDLEAFPDASKVIQVFQIQIQTKNYSIVQINWLTSNFVNENSLRVCFE